MRAYSDFLTASDLRNAVPGGCTLELLTIDAPRVRRHGWDVKLRRPASARHENTGRYGAGAEGAASWDDYGVWMAALFALDPAFKIANYDGREDFEAQTDGAYQVTS